MSTIALAEALKWYNALANAEFRGRGDREKSVRGRISDKTGIPESYLYRLQYKMREMNDVAGEPYRRLQAAYQGLCANVEQAAAAKRAERLEILHETAESARRSGGGVDQAFDHQVHTPEGVTRCRT